MSMSGISALIPTRFLTITAHLVMTIMIFWAREDNVRACLPIEYTTDQYTVKDTQLIIALSISLGLFVIELCGFFSGVSMFSHTQNVISAALHFGAVIALIFFMFDLQCSDSYWYIFGFCSFLPACLEISAIVALTCMGRAIVFHTSGAVASVYFVFINFPCQWINNVVIACNGFPALCEMAITLKRFCLARI